MARKSQSGHNIYPRSDGRWEGRHPIGRERGKTLYTYVYGKSYEEEEEKLKQAAAAKSETSQNAFAEVAQAWMEYKRPQVKPSTISSYTNVLHKYLIPAFGNKDICDISRADFNTLVCDLQENGGPDNIGLSAASVNVIMIVAKNIFNYASQEKGLPVANINGIQIRKEKKTDPPTLSAAAQDTLVVWLCENLTPCNLGILLCLTTGIRLGEMCALTWKDISKADQSVMVYKTMQRVQHLSEKKTEIVIQAPKSETSHRQVAVTRDIGRLLEVCRRNDNAYVLTGEEDRFMEPRKLKRRFTKALKACGLENVNFHVLRHTFATRSIEVGFDYKTLSASLGHSTINITLDLYVHPTMEQKRKNMNLFPPMSAVQQATIKMDDKQGHIHVNFQKN